MANQTYNVLVCEPMAEEGLKILQNHPALQVDFEPALPRDKLLNMIASYDCLLVRSQTTVDKTVLAKGTKLKLVGRAGVGIDNIDKAWAEQNNIRVINTPAGNSIATAELAFGLMLALARKIPWARDHVSGGQWSRSQFTGRELNGATLGIVGFGNVGRILAQRANAFGMRVLACDPMVDAAIFREYSTEKLTLDQILGHADFLSLHCGLNEQTRHIINEANLAKIKKGAMLINTARGELIDTKALIKALDSKQLASAALDVYAVEPPAKDEPLLKHPQILATPHLGASTNEAQKRVAIQLAEQTVAFFVERKFLSPLQVT